MNFIMTALQTMSHQWIAEVLFPDYMIEEAKLIDTQVAFSGLTKQDYIVRRLQCRDVVVQGNPSV